MRVSASPWPPLNRGCTREGLFNVGSGKARSFHDLAKAAFHALGLQEKIAYREMPEELRGKYQYYTQADLSRLRAAGYAAPMTSLEDGVRRRRCVP